MSYVECITSSGLRDSEATVSVTDVNGRNVYLRVERDFIRNDHLLPIGIVHKDVPAGKSLIELPHESDSGENRLWVTEAHIREE